MDNYYRDDVDNFKLVPLNIPNNFKGGFLPIGNSPMESNNMYTPFMNTNNIWSHHINPNYMRTTPMMNQNFPMMQHMNSMPFNNSGYFNNPGYMVSNCPMCQHLMQMYNTEPYPIIRTPIIVRKASDLFD